MNDSIIREYFCRVESRDVDFMKKATVMALGDYILNIAGEDADLNGFGVRELNARYNSSWVLTRMSMETYRMPCEHERLRITTWVSEVTRVMTTRNFEVFDDGGQRIAAAVTNWAMINVTTRRPMDLHKLDSYDSMTQNVVPPIELPRKLERPQNPHETIHRVVYSDVDFNAHANSMKYLQWAVDTIPLCEIEARRFARADINFLRESVYGELLTIATAEERGSCEGKKYVFETINESDTAVCRIALETV